MSDVAPAAIAPVVPADGEAKDVAPPEDHKAALNEAMKKANVRLRAKDREYVPRDIDDLTNKANRVFGLESEVEAFKKEKGEAAQVRSWRAAIDADDEGAAEEAFESLSPKAQQNAARWLQKKAEKWEADRQLPPETQEARRQLEERDRELRGYRQREEETKQSAQRQESAKVLRETQESVLGVAKTVMASMRVDGAKAPRAPAALLPFAARHMRVAMMAEAETGVAADPAEIAANVQRDVVEAFSSIVEGVPDDALYEAIGEPAVKRLLKAHLMRVKGVKSSKPTNGAPKSGAQTRDPAFGTPGYFR